MTVSKDTAIVTIVHGYVELAEMIDFGNSGEYFSPAYPARNVVQVTIWHRSPFGAAFKPKVSGRARQC